MIKIPSLWNSYLSWPVLLGLIAGSFELAAYIPSPFFFFLSSLSTLFLYISAITYGWRSGALSASIAYTVTFFIFIIKPDMLLDTVVLLKNIGVISFKFILPIIIAYTLPKKPSWKTLEKVVSIYGYMGILLLIVFMVLYQSSMGMDQIMAILEKLQHQVMEANKSKDTTEVINIYFQMLQLVPGLSIFDFLKQQAFQLLFVLYFFYIRPKIVMPKVLFGRLKIERIWLYITSIAIFGMVFSPSSFWGYMSFNIFIVTLVLFLLNGFDVIYQRLAKRRLKKSTIVLIFLFCYIFGWPLALILGIGFIDQFYSLRRLEA